MKSNYLVKRAALLLFVSVSVSVCFSQTIAGSKVIAGASINDSRPVKILADTSGRLHILAAVVPSFAGFFESPLPGSTVIAGALDSDTSQPQAIKVSEDGALYVTLDAGSNPTLSGMTLQNSAPEMGFSDTTASAKSLTIAVDSNLAQLRESAGASGSLFVLDLANNRVGIGTAAPSGVLDVLQGTGESRFSRTTGQYIKVTTDAGSHMISGVGSKDFVINNTNANSVAIYTNNASRLTINSTGQMLFNGVAFANLGTPAAGTMVWCTDCTVATPCSGSGSGAWAFRTAGPAWNCPF